jgi:FtsP/CotA-like multicopper oxidase with cupredoxin domain
MKRRNFLAILMGATGGSSSLYCGKEMPAVISCAPPISNGLDEEILSAGSRTTVTKNKLQILSSYPTLSSTSALSLTCMSANVALGGSKMTNAMTYDGNFPAKTIIVNQGPKNVYNTITIKNNLAEDTTTHWHGLIVDPGNDGGPSKIIKSVNGSMDYSFPVFQRASLNWYHPHLHMNTGKQINLGMAGLFIVRDAEEAALNLPSGEFEVPLIIRDATLDKNGNLSYKATSSGFAGQIPLVNGTQTPYLTVQPTLYRFRILNSSNARVFRLSLNKAGTVQKLYLIGNDGGLLDKKYDEQSIDISPAERLDLLISFADLGGSTLSLRDDLAGWELLEFRVSGTNKPITPPSTLSTISALTNPVTTRNFSFDGMTMINGAVYDMNRVDFQVPFDTTEKWVFKTSGNGPHPVHVHGASFQVISRTGGRGKTFNWEKGWKDTVLLQDGETIEILIRFTGFKGKYLLHCHKLEHEDAGMMANFEVV